MPRRKPLPDLADVDPAELQLAILVVLEERLGPQVRGLMHRVQFGQLLDSAGGARRVLAQALARIRQRGSEPRLQPAVGISGVAEIPGRLK
jgi:hypothetical protein